MPVKTRKHSKNTITSRGRRAGHKWFLGRRTAIVVAAVLVSLLAMGELYVQLLGPKANSVPGWIIDGDQLQNLVNYFPSSLSKKYFGTANTVVLKNFTGSNPSLPDGWSSQSGNHYTSYTNHSCGGGCVSLQRDIAGGKFLAPSKPAVLYDDEHWTRTPKSEQTNPCSAMNTFVQAAHQQGLSTILAPDQDLAGPGVIASYQGGESENWQTYLRLGLGTCAAQTGTETYHIMSQPFEAHWCENLLGKCQSSESDFVNFVTQATLQAKAVNPNVKISAGLSTNPQYFGYFQGAATLAAIMYRDYADVQRSINTIWLNVVGRNADTTALYFLSMLGKSKHTERRSSVLFLQPQAMLKNSQPSAGQARSFALNEKNSSMTFLSNQTIAGGTVLPAGTGEFQFWTDGSRGQSAKIDVTFGYCTDNCAHRTIAKNLTVRLHGNALGAASPNGAFTLKSDITLPNSGRYHLFVRLNVESPAAFNLLYGAKNAATNLATPVLLPV